MINKASRHFWSLFNQLPTDIQKLARKNYKLLKVNPQHPSLQFKPINKYWSVRVSINYRALAVSPESGVYVWFWIGTHAEYDRLIK